ncbi:sensor histidine kinase [Aquisediminimonas sediminicola]|uniref:sensor histidine kinase n=1 Tax=Alteraquisediminimonas sediminicola TaxID=2676787 RepID=UPI001C8DA215|nr:histidine kinase [Aquisediminimonas sediminicola]
MSLGPLRRKPFFADKDRAFWVLQTAGWGAYFVLRTLSGFANGVDLLFIVPMAISTATGYSLTLLMAAAYRRLIDQRPIITWTLSITVLMIAAVAYAMIETQAFITFYRPGERMNAPLFFGAFLLDSMLLLGWSALYYGINFYLMLEKQADQLLHLENQASSAQLAMLRYQLNPHFLFNTLNSISTLVLLKQTERANAMLSRLSSFLRYTLVNEPTAQVTLAQEFETLKLYLEIEKMRFEDRLRTEFTLDLAVTAVRLPSLLLQPLVENAIKYAVTPQEEGADITVDARLVGNRVQITVTDTGPGLNAPTPRSIESTGVGLANIRDRLQQAFGDDHSFEILPDTSEGFCVRINIPFQTEPQREAA